MGIGARCNDGKADVTSTRKFPVLPGLLLTLALVGGCSRASSGTPAPDASATAPHGTELPTELVGYNHTSEAIEFSVGEVSGGILMPGTGGGGFTCCVVLPVSWRAGLSVKVEWKNAHQSFSRIVPVPPYDPATVSDFNIHFLRSGEVTVFPLHYGLYHAGYPLTGKEAELVPGKPIVPLYK